MEAPEIKEQPDDWLSRRSYATQLLLEVWEAKRKRILALYKDGNLPTPFDLLCYCGQYVQWNCSARFAIESLDGERRDLYAEYVFGPIVKQLKEGQ